MELDNEFVEKYADKERSGNHPLLDSFNGLGYVVYKRTYARPIYDSEGSIHRTEEWHETVRRVVEGANRVGARLEYHELEKLFDLIWNLKCFPAGRMLWQLGTDNMDRLGGDSLVNCWFVDIKSVDDFVWLFERLMLGGGVGFNVTHGEYLGVVSKGEAVLTDGFDVDYVVTDNREGWGELLRKVLDANFRGRKFTYSVDGVRPEGTPIRTFGGVASGPGILVDGISRIQSIFDNANGRVLTSVEILDIGNIIGSIVVSGNVRRSAQIAIGESDDVAFLEAKRWDLGGIPSHRAMSNNSVVVKDFADLRLIEKFWQGYKGNGEPYGLLNLETAQQYGRMGEKNYDITIRGFNPCAEIPLANRESCNLSELVLPKLKSLAEARDAAVLLYKIQKAVAAMGYLDPTSNAITSENLRLGLSVTGVMQASDEQKGWLSDIYEHLKTVDHWWSATREWNESKRLTTVKPSGTLSLLGGVTPGGHPGFSEFHVRRVRMSANDPILDWCRDRGYPWEWVQTFEGEADVRTAVVEFPVQLPSHTVFADEMSAIDQLETVRWLQREWADNAVSITVYYEADELLEIQDYLVDHWSEFKSLSFLLKTDHGFAQAPLEAITEEEYHERVDKVEHTHQYATVLGLSELLDDDCATGACPVR